MNAIKASLQLCQLGESTDDGSRMFVLPEDLEHFIEIKLVVSFKFLEVLVGG